MEWLWIVSVGVTDVQFPAWSQDEYGQWTRLERFETGRAGVRSMHEGLLAALREGHVRFESELPRQLPRGVAQDLRLVFEKDGDVFAVGLDHKGDRYRISAVENEIPNAQETQLPLFCPKVQASLPVARERFGDGQVSVLVLNTRRDLAFREGPSEPVAAGPIVSRFIAEALGLRWVDGDGGVPNRLEHGTARWLDILTGHEALEDEEAQRNVVARLGAALGAWEGGPDVRVAVTTSGGLPPLKPLIERVPATRFGQDRVLLIDAPERSPVVAVPLAYGSRVSEREALRFNCAEALRAGDFASAYGLAGRAGDAAWAAQAHDGLGALLELPGEPIRLQGRSLPPFALTACSIETRLCMGDVIGALTRLGTFLESTAWELISRDVRIGELTLKVDRDEECLVGRIPPGHVLLNNRLVEEDGKGPNHHRVVGLTWRWTSWLRGRKGGHAAAGAGFGDFVDRYNDGAKNLRNRRIHGSETPVLPGDVEVCLKEAGLMTGSHLPFGDNFLALDEVVAICAGLGFAQLGARMRAHLDGVLTRVIEG